MTSARFHNVFIDQIIVPPDRHRKDMGDIAELADSIRRLGLLNPIVVTLDNVLRAGERRWLACKYLGWTHIPCHYFEELDEFQQMEIELDENIKRKDMKWQEEQTWLVKYYKLRCAHDPKWNHEKTAERIGQRQQWVSERLYVHREAKLDPKILDQTVFSTALRIAEVNKERRDKAISQSVDDAVDELLKGHKVETPKDVIHKDFCEWAKTYKGEKFNFLHCDFPYGINTDKRQQGNAITAQGGYPDSPETYWTLLKVLCENLDRMCAESAHIMFWFSMIQIRPSGSTNYADTLAFFKEYSDFKIDPLPLIWVKDGKGMVPDAWRKPRQIYETCLYGSRGDHPILTPKANAYVASIDGSRHASVKPEPVLRHFFQMFVDKNTRMLDPTCGSGAALRVAEELGANRVLGLEIDKQFAEDAAIALEDSRRARATVVG